VLLVCPGDEERPTWRRRRRNDARLQDFKTFFQEKGATSQQKQ
jgi:hypothetical protein